MRWLPRQSTGIESLTLPGETIEFRLSPSRDLIAAKVVLRLALSSDPVDQRHFIHPIFGMRQPHPTRTPSPSLPSLLQQLQVFDEPFGLTSSTIDRTGRSSTGVEA
jgi:hypothetical protein